MAEAVHKTANPVLVDKYAQKTALRLGVAPEAVRLEFRSDPSPVALRRTRRIERARTRTSARPSSHEFWLLKLLLLQDEAVAWANAHLDVNWVQHTVVREIVAARFSRFEQQSDAAATALLGQFEDPSVRSLISEALAEARSIPNPMQQVQDLVLRLRNQFIDQELNRLIQRCSLPGVSDAERLQLLQQQQELRRTKKLPLEPRSQAPT